MRYRRIHAFVRRRVIVCASTGRVRVFDRRRGRSAELCGRKTQPARGRHRALHGQRQEQQDQNGAMKTSHGGKI